MSALSDLDTGSSFSLDEELTDLTDVAVMVDYRISCTSFKEYWRMQTSLLSRARTKTQMLVIQKKRWLIIGGHIKELGQR